MTETPKTVVSAQELGAVYWQFATKFTLEFCKKFPLADAPDKEALNARVIEVLALHLWITIKCVGTHEGPALDELHRLFLESVAKDLAAGQPLAKLRERLLARYKLYFQSWKDDDKGIQEQLLVAAAPILFAQPELPPVTKVHFMSWVLGSMAAALKMRGELELKQ